MFFVTLPLFATVILPRTWDRDHFETVDRTLTGSDPPDGLRRSHREVEGRV